MIRPASIPLTSSLGLALRLSGPAALGILAGVGCGRSPSKELPASATEAAGQPTAATAGPQQDALVPVPEGWDPEAFTTAITPTLTKLQAALEREQAPEGDDFRHALHASFECDPLRPRELEPALELGPLARRRAHLVPATAAGLQPSGDASSAASEPVRERLQGSEGLIGALGELRALVHGAGAVELLLEVVAVEPLPGERATTTLLVQSRGAGPRQFEARWLCTWEAFRSHDPWLRSIDLLAYEEIERRTAEPFFADTTEAVLGADPLFESIVRPGLNHWLARLDRGLGSRFFGHHGLAVADIDGDGLDDLYVCLNGGLPNRLYIQNPDGTASERSQAAGLDFLDHTQSALFVDLDGDGDQDAAVATDALVLLRNDGHTRFEASARFPSMAAFTSLAAADFDLDGDLDLYACASRIDERVVPDPFFDAHNGPPDLLLRNDGEWRFTDVTAESGLDADNDRFSLSASWADYDGDGDPDLYVVNDFSHSKLFRNDGGSFRDVAVEAGVRNIAAGHSADWGDANGDGRPDLYVGNVFAPAGHRLSALWSTGEGHGLSRHELFERYSRGNALYANRGDGTFRDVSEEQGAGLGRWAWSSVFTEVDNDGREDLLVANGFVTNEFEEDL